MAAVQAACRNPHPVQIAPRFSRAAIRSGIPERMALSAPGSLKPWRVVSDCADSRKVKLPEHWILKAVCGYLATTNAVASAGVKGSDIAAPQPDIFAPRFDPAGLLTAVAVDAASGRLLMLAHMDSEALAKTRETGFAHFHSRSRGRLWMKGETSGHTLRVLEIRVDCDQDAIELRVEAAGPACHTGAPSCFYRRLDGDELIDLNN